MQIPIKNTCTLCYSHRHSHNVTTEGTQRNQWIELSWVSWLHSDLHTNSQQCTYTQRQTHSASVRFNSYCKTNAMLKLVKICKLFIIVHIVAVVVVVVVVAAAAPSLLPSMVFTISLRHQMRKLNIKIHTQTENEKNKNTADYGCKWEKRMNRTNRLGAVSGKARMK